MSIAEGVIRVSPKGVGYFVFPDKREVKVETADLGVALDGDKVRLSYSGESGKVEAILNRAKQMFVGIVNEPTEKSGQFVLLPDDMRFYRTMVLPDTSAAQKAVGKKVLVALDEWTDAAQDPTGSIKLVIGIPGENETEMRAIAIAKGFSLDFPAAVLNETDKIKQTATEDMVADVPNRRDFRSITTFTIDPITAKDFDDALSFADLGDDVYEVGVHIADISHYVRPSTALDTEAERRATSVYLIDRTIPMLPPVLSDDICSLVPDQDRLTFGAVFKINKNGEVSDQWFGRTIIHSDKRFSYEEAQEVLDKKAGEYYTELNILNEIAYKLRAAKVEAGAISFETEELQIVLDDAGKPIDIKRKVRTDTHLLVEDFMLLANRKVAEYVSELNKNQADKFVYRIHDQPDQERLANLANFLKPLGYQLEINGQDIKPAQINTLLKDVEDTPEAYIVNRATVQSMAKAIYSTKNIGHYGLAFRYYTHFTSPIRRYPDVLVHRLLAIYLEGKQPPPETLEKLSDQMIHASIMERLAAEAERESIRYKQVEYMQDKLDRPAEAIISGVNERGVFVAEVATGVEGMIRLGALGDDYFEFDAKKFAVVGRRTGQAFRLGDAVKVKAVKADLLRKQIDYVLVK
ncbi:MAG: ribonuclease R [Candidatus Vogelbacteria bacterium]|nr:ribonuclease R [Candidatus Vogelbacteria bacterium]